MKFGTAIPQYLMFQEIEAGRRDNVVRLVQAIEDAGFSFISVGDHIVHPGVSHSKHDDPEKVWYGDVFSVLAFYSAFSKTLRLLTGVLILPYRQPFAAAHAVATVDRLSGGRAMLGIGSGYAKLEFEAFGIPLKERGPMTDEYLEIMDLLLSQRNVSYEGKYYKFHNVSLLFQPVQKPRPPIWVGGSGKRALERAIRRGDVWEPIASGFKAAGKRPIRAAVTPRELAADLKDANRRRKELFGDTVQPLQAALSASTALMFTRRSGPRQGPPNLQDSYITGTGTAEELAEHLNLYVEAGASAVSMALSSMTVDGCLRDIDIVANKVMPRVK